MFIKSYVQILVCKNPIKLVRRKSRLSYFHNVGQEPLRPLTFGKLLEETVHDHGDKLAVISRHQNKRLTYSEVLHLADRLAASLIVTGHQKGDRVGIWAPNSVEWYVANYACARAGLVMVAINPAYRPKEIEYCIKSVDIRGIVCGHAFRGQNYYEILNTISPELSKCEPGKLDSKNLPSLKCVITTGDESLRGTYNFNEILDIADDDTINAVKSNQNDIRIDDPCNIQFTSGTTGNPKAAVVSHFALVNNGFYVGKRNELGLKHHIACVQVPLFHAYGTVIATSASLNYGTTMVLPAQGFNAHESLNALKEENCTVIHGTPTMYVDLIKVQEERKEKISAEIAVSGGALCSPHLFKEMLRVLGVQRVKSVYGLSETAAVVFQSLHDDDEKKSTSTVGHLHEHVEAKVVDQDDRIVPIGTPGELCIRGYPTMLCYWGNEEKTKETIGLDRWLRTGDQFVMDENGYGKVIGRLKDVIIRGGENIYPGEVEAYLNTHPSILDTQVIGIPHGRLGEEVCACVRLKENRTITLEELKNFCKGNIAYYKIPSVLEIVELFPKTASGKIQKFKLAEQLLKQKNIK